MSCGSTVCRAVALTTLAAASAALGGGSVATTFTYQGQLKEEGRPANSDFDFEFRLFAAATGGTQIGESIYVEYVKVIDGLFSVDLQFNSPDAFIGESRWLEIAVKQSAAQGDPRTLSPRQSLTAVPFATYALGGPGGTGQYWSLTPDGGDLYFAGGDVGR